MLDVITIGTATRDVFLTSPLFKVVRDPEHLERLGFPTGEAQCFALGAKLEVGEPVMTIGGGATNAAVTFARQSFRTAALVKVGEDRNGDAVLEDLRRENVVPFAVRTRDHGTGYSVILSSPTGERTILNYRGAAETMRSAEVPWKKLRARWAYIVPSHIPLPVMLRIVAHLKKNKTRIAMNPSQYYLALGARRLAPILRSLDVMLTNREEAAYLTGVRYEDERGIFKKFDELVRGIAVMTDGPRGVLVSDGSRIYRAGVFKEKKIVSRTGAGDAFGSGFVAGLARAAAGPSTPRAVEEAIRLGSANATSVVEHVGAQVGILTTGEFRRQRRWRSLKITARAV